jgi:hypothetical protein
MKKWTSLLEVSLELDICRNTLLGLVRSSFKYREDFKVVCHKTYVSKSTYKKLKKIAKIIQG